MLKEEIDKAKRLVTTDTVQMTIGEVAYNGETLAASSSGNALVGAYMTRLGFGYDAIAFVTAAPPDRVQWLHPKDARS